MAEELRGDVLVVDDTPGNLRVLAMVLTRGGHVPRPVRSAFSIVRPLCEGKPARSAAMVAIGNRIMEGRETSGPPARRQRLSAVRDSGEPQEHKRHGALAPGHADGWHLTIFRRCSAFVRVASASAVYR